MKVGIDGFSFRFQNWSIEEMIVKSNEMGFSALALDLAEINLTQEEIKKALSLSKKINLQLFASIQAILPDNIFNANTETIDNHIQSLKQNLEIARRFKSPIVRSYILDTDSKHIGSDQTLSQAEKILKKLIPFIKEYQIVIALENHRDYLSKDLASFVAKINSPQVRVCYDFGNQIPIQESPIDALDNLAKYTKMVHIKDVALNFNGESYDWRSVPLGKGSLPLRELLTKVKDTDPYIFLEISTSRQPTTTMFDSDDIKSSFYNFVKKHSSWSSELDTYLNRESVSIQKISEQDLLHIKESYLWINKHLK